LFASAETLTGRHRGDAADYSDIARAIADHGAARTVREDLAQMYRRVAFNVLAGNRDDHLRNHGFLRTVEGWRLAPAFDLNPARGGREHALAVNGVAFAPSTTDVLASRVHFGLGEDAARAIIREVAAALARWRTIAGVAGIRAAEQDRVGVAFAALESVEGALAT
jgi:serine/threonine-protein kinase HipA